MTLPADDPLPSLAHVTAGSTTVLGIDRDILERALTLIRDKYKLAAEASIFLERKTRTSSINSGIANQRDAASHLATLLRMNGASRTEQEKQLANIEEHLRRAVMEPYEKTVQLLQARALEQLERYKQHVLTLPNLKDLIPSAPSLQQISTHLDAVDTIAANARCAKLENSWTDAWEEGVRLFISAVADLEHLHGEIEQHIIRAQQIEREKESRLWAETHAAEQISAVRAAAQEQIGEVRKNAASSRRRTYMLLPVSALLGLALKILWDWLTRP